MFLNIYDDFFAGQEAHAYELFGCHKRAGGVEFVLFAPHAASVEVFLSKDNFQVLYPLQKVDERGVWSLFLKGVVCIYSYRFKIGDGKGHFVDKSDPFAFYSERRPANASVMYDFSCFDFGDDYQKFTGPLNIYEVHLGGFKKDGELVSYQSLKDSLVPYVRDMGYSHVEFMPLSEHPLDESWGYQSSGFFSITSRYGTPYDLRDLISCFHSVGIGVILDCVFLHFVKDLFSLGNFDFWPVYEYEEADLKQSEWDTWYFDLRKPYVRSFLLSSAVFFLERYHFDGLRLDAVSHFIYRKGNKNWGENAEGLAFIRYFNKRLKELFPDCLLIAEDSSDYPRVCQNLGFDYKWDLGWMNDTLRYYAIDPLYRKYHHNIINFSMWYFYSEHFVLPFSHDEVVHSKKTIIDKMWGSYEQKFAQCRNLFVYMYTHPGKKLNFMGNEIASFREFDERRQLDWLLLAYPVHEAFQRLVRDLNNIYRYYPAFYEDANFSWIDADNAEQSLYSYYRYDEENCFVIVINMLPLDYTSFKLGVPFKGEYLELLNSEKDIYGGCNMCNYRPLTALKSPKNGLDYSIEMTIAPFSAIILQNKKTD